MFLWAIGSLGCGSPLGSCFLDLLPMAKAYLQKFTATESAPCWASLSRQKTFGFLECSDTVSNCNLSSFGSTSRLKLTVDVASFLVFVSGSGPTKKARRCQGSKLRRRRFCGVYMYLCISLYIYVYTHAHSKTYIYIYIYR